MELARYPGSGSYTAKLVWTALVHTSKFPIKAKDISKTIWELLGENVHATSVSSALKDLASRGFILRTRVYTDRALFNYAPTMKFITMVEAN